MTYEDSFRFFSVLHSPRYVLAARICVFTGVIDILADFIAIRRTWVNPCSNPESCSCDHSITI
jgi:hypothetical protein